MRITYRSKPCLNIAIVWSSWLLLKHRWSYLWLLVTIKIKAHWSYICCCILWTHLSHILYVFIIEDKESRTIHLPSSCKVSCLVESTSRLRSALFESCNILLIICCELDLLMKCLTTTLSVSCSFIIIVSSEIVELLSKCFLHWVQCTLQEAKDTVWVIFFVFFLDVSKTI